MPKVLVVDDEVEITSALRRVLRRDFVVEVAGGGEEALARLEAFAPDIVLSDFRMPGMTGGQLLAEVKRRSPWTLRLILSGYADLGSVLSSINDGEISRFLSKPWDGPELIATLNRLLQERALLRELAEPLAALSPLAPSTVHGESSLAVTARLTGHPFGEEAAVAFIQSVAGALEERAVRVISGALARHGGKIQFTAELGGEQSLMLEVPLRPVKEPLNVAG